MTAWRRRTACPSSRRVSGPDRLVRKDGPGGSPLSAVVMRRAFVRSDDAPKMLSKTSNRWGRGSCAFIGKDDFPKGVTGHVFPTASRSMPYRGFPHAGIGARFDGLRAGSHATRPGVQEFVIARPAVARAGRRPGASATAYRGGKMPTQGATALQDLGDRIPRSRRSNQRQS
jgi:hypothetical protein